MHYFVLSLLIQKVNLSWSLSIHRSEVRSLAFQWIPSKKFKLLSCFLTHILDNALALCGPIETMIHELTHMLLIKLQLSLIRVIWFSFESTYVERRVNTLSKQIISLVKVFGHFTKTFWCETCSGEAALIQYIGSRLCLGFWALEERIVVSRVFVLWEFVFILIIIFHLIYLILNNFWMRFWGISSKDYSLI
jgi:hypothetical protein